MRAEVVDFFELANTAHLPELLATKVADEFGDLSHSGLWTNRVFDVLNGFLPASSVANDQAVFQHHTVVAVLWDSFTTVGAYVSFPHGYLQKNAAQIRNTDMVSQNTNTLKPIISSLRA